MTSCRRLSPLLLFALVPLAGVAARPPDAAQAPAVAGIDTTEPDDTDTDDSGTTDAETTVADDSEFNDETDPARQEWLEFAAEADADTFAGGADLKDIVDGNRVLMIGDSIMASTASRYGGEMCNEVVAGGWAVEVDAETGRFIDFGDKVLDARIDADFDAVVILLGNNYGANPDVYEDYLRDLVERIDDRPIVLSTVTVFQPNRREVNNIIYEIAQDFDNIRVIDWAGETERNVALTGGDGLHLSDLGRARFAAMVADELGDAPTASGDGECLRSSFTDDSAGSGNTGPVEGQVTMPPSQTINTSRPTPTAPVPVETIAPATSTPGGGTGGGGDTTTPTPAPTTPAPTTPTPTPAPTPTLAPTTTLAP